jgi:hypothetical protein
VHALHVLQAALDALALEIVQDAQISFYFTIFNASLIAPTVLTNLVPFAKPVLLHAIHAQETLQAVRVARRDNYSLMQHA